MSSNYIINIIHTSADLDTFEELFLYCHKSLYCHKVLKFFWVFGLNLKLPVIVNCFRFLQINKDFLLIPVKSKDLFV